MSSRHVRGDGDETFDGTDGGGGEPAWRREGRGAKTIDKSAVHGWHLMVDPAKGKGRLILTVYEDLWVVRVGFDATGKRGYFTVFNKDGSDIQQGRTHNLRFDPSGLGFDAVATGFRHGKVEGAMVFFEHRGFKHAIGRRQHKTVLGQTGQKVMAIGLTGTAKALEYARKCLD